MFHLNARSPGKKTKQNKRRCLLMLCSVTYHDFDAYAFTETMETWFNSDDDSNLIDLDSY